METTLSQNLKKSTTAFPSILFLVGLTVIFLVPIINIAPKYQTFIHSFRPELAIAVFTFAYAVWACLNSSFLDFLRRLHRIEIVCVLLPLGLSIGWASLSMLWAQSAGGAIHYACLWVCYSSIYLVARYFLSSKRSFRPVIYAVLVFIAIIALPAIFEYNAALLFGETPQLTGRYAKYAELINVLAPVLMAYSLSSKGRLYWISTAAVVVIWLFDLAVVSRSGIGIFIIITAATITAMLVLKRFRHLLRRSAILLTLLTLSTLVSLSIGYFSAGQIPIADRMQSENNAASTDSRPFMIAVGLEMWGANKLTGIGADNFGREFSVYRARYAKQNADDPNLSLSFLESGYPERTHNEYVQILAELGLIGALIFASFLAGIAYLFFFVVWRRFRVDLVTIGAFIGLAGFLASSLVSSYSFRIPQNGLAFFFVLAIAVTGTLRGRPLSESGDKDRPCWPIALGLIVAIMGSVGLLIFSATRLAAVHFLIEAEQQATVDDAMPYYQKALALDSENGHLYASIGGNMMINGDPSGAAYYLRKAIEVGRSTSIDYSYLSTSQILAGDRASALSTLEEGIGVYPYSVFLRTKYAVALKDDGQVEKSNSEFVKAREIDEKQALVWYKYIDSGGNKASIESFEQGLPSLMELKPQVAIYAVKRERELRFPEEKFVIPPQ